MDTVIHDSTLLQALAGKTVIVTGGANGIGLEVVRLCHSYGANVVVADLGGAIAITKPQEAELDKSSRTLFLPCDVAMWTDISNVFSMAVDRFHKIDIVIPCAGIMETRRFFDFNTDDNGHLQEDARSSVVIDVNLKGTMNALRLAVFHMMNNNLDNDGWKGSITLVSSTSGYIGGTEVVSYISSKHGITGLLRASHAEAKRKGVRLNAVAPFITPSRITSSYSDAWIAKGLPTNKASEVALAIVQMTLKTDRVGKCDMVVGGKSREVEGPIAATLNIWASEELSKNFKQARDFFANIGGYPLPSINR